MTTPIPPRYYFDDALFVLERERLFHSDWQFVGLTSDLEQPNDYIAADVGDYSVVVQNFDGELKAFLNVCSHRFSRIRCADTGNGPLRCPYHGWTYNQHGVPTGIPSRPRFSNLKEKIPGLALRPFPLAVCGKFIFVRIAPEGPSLAEFLGGVAETLEQVSDGLDTRIDRTEWFIDANWKVVIENTLEAYHVGFVHPTTFKPLGLQGLDFRFDGAHAAYLGHIDDAANAPAQRLRSKFSSRVFTPDGYFHQLVFPNLLTSTSHGLVTSVQYHHAIAPGRTRMVSHLFHKAPDTDAKITAGMLDVLYDAARRFNLTTLQEDADICRAVQLGVHQADKPGLLSDEEVRILRFHDAYLARMAPAARGERR